MICLNPAVKADSLLWIRILILEAGKKRTQTKDNKWELGTIGESENEPPFTYYCSILARRADSPNHQILYPSSSGHLYAWLASTLQVPKHRVTGKSYRAGAKRGVTDEVSPQR